MWKTLLNILQSVLTLARDLEENRKEIKELNETIYKLALIVRGLSDKVDGQAQHQALDRKALILQLKNELPQSAKRKRVPPARKNKRQNRAR